MVPQWASDALADESSIDLRRAAVVLVVVAAHIALLLLIGRTAQLGEEAREVVFLPLPVTPSESSREPPASDTSSLVPDRPPAEPMPRESTSSTEPVLPREPAAPVDWFAEARKSAESFEQRQRVERERRSFTGPREGEGIAGLRNRKPACPFEQCEPGWGEGFSVFERSKRGRIEKTPDGETIRWINNHCYQILVSANEFHRGLNKCVKSLDKQAARGDLFDHMNDVPLPAEKGFDVP